jgi:adhesin transport system outer membrane protein
MPKVNHEVESESKNYRNPALGTSQAEGRAMLAMRYRLLDGGLSAAVSDQIVARLEGGDSGFIHERLQIMADVRQAYRAIESAERKTKLVAEGVESSRRVRDLYTEQFGAGKRTIFELLDGQMAFYTARRSQIETSFEAVRARADVLKAMGDLTVELAGVRPKSP